jgi:ABC-type branched-subunit amino acid transport system permease subunit
MTDGGSEQIIADEDTTIEESLAVTFGGYEIVLSRLLAGGLVLLLVLAPMLVSGYFVRLLILSLVLAIFAVSVDLVWGYGGILTFGHAAFYGLGAYLMAKTSIELSMVAAGYVGILLAIILPGLLGTVIAGILFYRGIGEEYFTIITLAIAIIANQAALIFNEVTGGSNGLTGVPPLEVGVPGSEMITLTGDLFYYAALAALITVYFITRRIVRSPFGTTLVAIDENPLKASSLGYNPATYKTLVFGLSAAIAGFAGALYAAYSGFVSPPVLGFILSTEVLIWVLVGGRGTVIGPAIGATLLTLAENMFSGVFLASWVLLLGIALIVIVLVFPDGIIGVLDIIETKIQERREDQ